MATFTITSSINIDALPKKVGSDTYNINAGALFVDQDTRFGLNATAASSMGNITLSPTLGGTIEFNAQNVRLVPFATGSGTVPAPNTPVSGAFGSGLLTAVYQNLSSSALLTGSAIPGTGYLKIKNWNSASFSNGEAITLSGVTANVSGSDSVGWIEIVGVDALTVTVNRLNTFKVRGDWFDLGTTTGARATTYQIPSNGAIVYLPGVWVETTASSNTYEFYPCAGSVTALVANIATDEVRGRWCWISTTGLLRFGNDGTNSTGGFIPEAGRRVRIPNIFFMCCTAAAPTVNVLPNATLATRYEFATTGGGVLDIRNACFNWYLNTNQSFSVSLVNTGILTALVATEMGSPIAWSHVGIGQEAANTQTGLTLSLNFAGGTMDHCTWTRATLATASSYVQSWIDCTGFTVTNERNHALGGNRGNSGTGSHQLSRVSNCSWTNTTLGARCLISTCSDITYKSTIYYDNPATTTPTAIPHYCWSLASGCQRLKFDGLTFGGLTMVQPYSGILEVGVAGCKNIQLRNLGTYASPLDLGGEQQTDVSWSRVTTTATVTKVAHGLKTNNIVYVLISDSVAAITVAAKTVTSTPTADTFTFTCLNAGNASGKLTYYPLVTAVLYTCISGAGNTLEIKRCYTTHTRTNLYTSDNANKNVVQENVYGDYAVASASPALLNASYKGIGNSLSLAAQTSCYGNIWFDCFQSDLPSVVSNVPWSRVTTTATVTSSLHNLRTGLFANVTTSSSAAAVILGKKTVTALSGDLFQFTCLNAGSTTGTLTFEPMEGRIGLFLNESTAETIDQYTIDAGSPSFTSAGSLYMPNVNDQITFNCPYYVISHTNFPISEIVMAGGTLTNYDITYSIDKNNGNGFGSYKNLSYPRSGGGGTVGLTNITMTNTAGVAVGDYVFGTNVAPLARVTNITDSVTIVVDNANVGTVSGILRFNQLPNEPGINAQLGFKLKIKVKTTTANATAITSLYITTSSTSTSRAYQYPLDLGSLVLTGLKNPTEVRVFDTGTTTEIAGTGSENVVSGTFAASIDVAAHPTVDISILSLGYQNTRLLAVSVPVAGVTIPVQQIVDRQYLNP